MRSFRVRWHGRGRLVPQFLVADPESRTCFFFFFLYLSRSFGKCMGNSLQFSNERRFHDWLRIILLYHQISHIIIGYVLYEYESTGAPLVRSLRCVMRRDRTMIWHKGRGGRVVSHHSRVRAPPWSPRGSRPTSTWSGGVHPEELAGGGTQWREMMRRTTQGALPPYPVTSERSDPGTKRERSRAAGPRPGGG